MKKFIFLIIFLFILSPFFVLAQLDYPYPVIPGTTITITEESTIGDLIKYLTSWAIIIGAIIAFLVLIYYGFIYLTSSFGAPERVKEAKDKIFNAFLGLAILIGSYVIMLLINPQFMILRLEKQPIDEGIVLLSETGYDALKQGAATIEELVMQQKAVYFFNSTDLQKYPLWGARKAAFGELVSTEINCNNCGTSSIKPCDVTEANFKNFTLHSLVFLPKSQKDIKIIAYANKNYKGSADVNISPKIVEYLPEGKLDADGRVDKQASEIDYSKINEIDFASFNTIGPKYKRTKECSDSKIIYYRPSLNASTDYPPVNRPPLSLLRVPYGPGVYLYSDRIGEQIYFKKDGNYPKFKRGSFKAEKIELKNVEKVHDFIAVLYEKKNFDGDFKIIFEERGVITPGATAPTIYVGGYEAPDYGDLVNTPYPPRQTINTGVLAVLSYGVKELNKVSSAYVRELSDDISKYLRRETHDVSECKRVWLCTGVNYTGECIVFTRRKDDNTLDFPESEYRKHPDVWIVPVDIIFLRPVDLKEDLRIDPEITALKTDTPLKKYIEGQTDLEEKLFDIKDVFNDKIKSIKIEGSDTGTCMVVLYEKFNNDSYFPGKNSEVFFSSVPDLKGRKIHKCLYFRRLLIWVDNPCASAIAVFPVKE